MGCSTRADLPHRRCLECLRSGLGAFREAWGSRDSSHTGLYALFYHHPYARARRHRSAHGYGRKRPS